MNQKDEKRFRTSPCLHPALSFNDLLSEAQSLLCQRDIKPLNLDGSIIDGHLLT